MKKILVLSLVLTLAFGLTSCASGTTSTADKSGLVTQNDTNESTSNQTADSSITQSVAETAEDGCYSYENIRHTYQRL